MADVFLSYRNTPERRAFVKRLALLLRAHEVTVWWDYGLEAGESYRAQITDELAKARIVAPLWCADGKRRLTEEGVTRARNRLRGVKDRLKAGTISKAEARAKVQAWRAHADFAHAQHLQRAILRDVALDVRKRPRRKRKI